MTSAQVQTRSGGTTSPAIFMRGKSPGMVMASHDGKRILPTFKYTGGSEFIKKCIRDRKLFDRDMTELFAASGFGGEFHCSVHRPVKGNQHVRGLKLKSHAHGVLIEANYGGTDDILQMSVIAPVDCRDPMWFHELLRKGQQFLHEEDEDNALERRASYGRAGDQNFRAEREKYAQRLRPAAPTPAPREEAPAPVAAAPAPSPAPAPAVAPAPVPQSPVEPQKPVTARSAPFYKDMTSLQLFMSTLEEHATPEGFVTRSNCTGILVKEGFAQSAGAGSMLRGVITEGHLVQQDNHEMLRFGGMWLTAWFQKNGIEQPASAEAQRPPEGKITLGDLQEIDRLTDEAEELRLKRERLASSLQELQSKIATKRSELEELETQAQRLQVEHDGVDAQLSDSKYIEATESLAMLQKLLGKKA